MQWIAFVGSECQHSVPLAFQKAIQKILDFSAPRFISLVKGKGNFLLPVNVTNICSENKETASLNQHVMI